MLTDLSDRDPYTLSPAEKFLAAIPHENRAIALTALIEGTNPDLRDNITPYAWRSLWARPSQLIPTKPHRVWLILAGRGFGKALADDTPICTPTGWVCMGDLEPGDIVFDETGKPCTVTAVYPQGPKPGWRLTFSDGATIDACDEHQWVTATARFRKQVNRGAEQWDTWAAQPAITTQQLVDTLTVGKRGDRNHAVPVTEALQLAPADLPIDPYLFGVWLGDGSSAGAEITCHDDDAPWYQQAATEAGEAWKFARRRHDDQPVATWSIGARPPQRDKLGRMTGNGSFHSRLRDLGVLNNKHVPVCYMRASAPQRLALLQGLIDTDGHVTQRKYVEFCSTTEPLADAVAELARSLGERPRISESDATLNGRVVGRRWRVTWRARFQVARLPRKQIDLPEAQQLRLSHRVVVDAERIPAIPMTCITVDSPSSLFLAGRAMIPTHNTRTGSESVRELVKSGTVPQVTIIGPTAADARDVMIEGPESGLLAVHPPKWRPIYEPSKRLLTWPNGTIGHIRSAEDPESVRGLQQALIWGDEPGSWRYGQETWDNAMLGLRVGKNPRAIVTGTPKPYKWLRDIHDHPATVVTRGSSFDNAGNLATPFIEMLLDRYDGTRLGLQEIYAEFLDEVEGALWTIARIEATRIASFNRETPCTSIAVGTTVAARTKLGLGPLDFTPTAMGKAWRTVVAVDPPATSAECGIVVATAPVNGRAGHDHAVVLDDSSIAGPPEEWGAKAVQAYRTHQAERIVVEANQGGDMVRSTIHAVDSTVPVEKLHASKSKAARAEPIATLYAKGWVHHLGTLAGLEQQMSTWVPGVSKSPDRVDALVWAIAELLQPPGLSGPARISSPHNYR